MVKFGDALPFPYGAGWESSSWLASAVLSWSLEETFEELEAF